MTDKVTRQGPAAQQPAETADGAAATAVPDQTVAVPIAANDGELSDADLDRVSGGANDVRPPVRTLLSRSQ